MKNNKVVYFCYNFNAFSRLVVNSLFSFKAFFVAFLRAALGLEGPFILTKSIAFDAKG